MEDTNKKEAPRHNTTQGGQSQNRPRVQSTHQPAQARAIELLDEIGVEEERLSVGGGGSHIGADAQLRKERQGPEEGMVAAYPQP